MEQEKVDALNELVEALMEWGVIYDEYPYEFMMPERTKKAVQEYARVMGLDYEDETGVIRFRKRGT